MASVQAAVRASPATWARANLFRTWYDSVLTLTLGLPLAYGVYRLLRFVFITARWEAIQTNLTLITVGRYPRTELWRVFVATGLVLFLASVALGAAGRLLQITDPERAAGRQRGVFVAVRRFWPLLFLVFVFLAFSRQPVTIASSVAMLACVPAGFQLGRRTSVAVARRAWLLPVAGTILAYLLLTNFGAIRLEAWGGLLLTLFLAAGAIALSFPIGVLAALGRRSTLPVMRVASISYIELIRGVPLITLLFMGNFALEFFVPPQLVPDRIVRAIIMLTIFTSAYIAEDVRGGLQSIPKGQVESAQALGLSHLATLRQIVLPQALRNVIPALVGQFISLFKDTSLVGIIGLTELLQVLRRLIPSQPGFAGAGLFAELLVFAALGYWCITYTMLRESQRLEHRLGLGER